MNDTNMPMNDIAASSGGRLSAERRRPALPPAADGDR